MQTKKISRTVGSICLAIGLLLPVNASAIFGWVPVVGKHAANGITLLATGTIGTGYCGYLSLFSSDEKKASFTECTKGVWAYELTRFIGDEKNAIGDFVGWLLNIAHAGINPNRFGKIALIAENGAWVAYCEGFHHKAIPIVVPTEFLKGVHLLIHGALTAGDPVDLINGGLMFAYKGGKWALSHMGYEVGDDSDLLAQSILEAVAGFAAPEPEQALHQE